jgi:putative phosphoesterase
MNSSTRSPFVGVLSDTHGELPSGVLRALRGAVHIVHAGDSERDGGIGALRTVAPLCAVRGNMDRAGFGARLPPTALIEVQGVTIYALHDLTLLDLDPSAAGVRVVIHGHTHTPQTLERNGVLYLNPGSPVKPRSGTGPTVARLYLGPEGPMAEIVKLT